MDRENQLDKISEEVPNRNHWKTLKGCVKVLGPVKTSTKIFETEESPTINKVGEVLYDFQEGLKSF